MGRNVKNLDAELVKKVQGLLADGHLQRNIAKRCRIDIRWVSEIKKALEDEAREQVEEVQAERSIADDVTPEGRDTVEASDEDYLTKLRRKLRKAIPINQRVKTIKALLSSENAQLKKAGLDQLNQIEGVGKKGSDKPYEAGPIFIIDTIPDFRPTRRADDGEEESSSSTRKEDVSEEDEGGGD